MSLPGGWKLDEWRQCEHELEGGQPPNGYGLGCGPSVLRQSGARPTADPATGAVAAPGSGGGGRRARGDGDPHRSAPGVAGGGADRGGLLLDLELPAGDRGAGRRCPVATGDPADRAADVVRDAAGVPAGGGGGGGGG